jgi:hypothetical protein
MAHTPIVNYNKLGLKVNEKESYKEVRLTKPNYDNLSLSDEELRYLVENANNYNANMLVEQITDIFKRYRMIYIILKLSEFCLSLFLIGLTLDKREYIINSLTRIYTDINYQMSSLFFYFIMTICCISSVIFYVYGAISLYKLNVYYAKIYSSISLFTAITTIVLVYVNM